MEGYFTFQWGVCFLNGGGEGGSFLSGGWMPHWGALVLKEGGFRKKLLDGGHPPTMGNPVEYAEKNSNHTAAKKFHVAVRG